jgi:LacI family gluconate utilization system Gnt-I transcriptional repressor
VLTGDDFRAVARGQAFVDASAMLGLAGAPLFKVHAPSTVIDGRTGLAELLARHPRIDAVACSTDVLALGVLIEAQARGLRVPEDLAIVGFGDLIYSRVSHPTLTTIRIDGAAIGRIAAEFIMGRDSGKFSESRVVDVGFSIVGRESA